MKRKVICRLIYLVFIINWALTGCGNSSNEVVTALEPPTKINETYSNGEALLSWDRSYGAKSYKVYLCKVGTFSKDYQLLGETTETCYRIEGLSKYHQYLVAVRSVNGATESINSYPALIDLTPNFDVIVFNEEMGSTENWKLVASVSDILLGSEVGIVVNNSSLKLNCTRANYSLALPKLESGQSVSISIKNDTEGINLSRTLTVPDNTIKITNSQDVIDGFPKLLSNDIQSLKLGLEETNGSGKCFVRICLFDLNKKAIVSTFLPTVIDINNISLDSWFHLKNYSKVAKYFSIYVSSSNFCEFDEISRFSVVAPQVATVSNLN